MASSLNPTIEIESTPPPTFNNDSPFSVELISQAGTINFNPRNVLASNNI